MFERQNDRDDRKTGSHASGPSGLTIGGVCQQLGSEFPDISISKIRYLEDQKLLSPHRTTGGYRLYAPRDIERLRTILRVQRDRFLPLSVIRRELAAGRIEVEETEKATSDTTPGTYSIEELQRTTGAKLELLRELREYGLIQAEQSGGKQIFSENDREIATAAAELARYGVAGRNLRVFKSSAEREASLLEQILAPALRSRNEKRRREAHDTLEGLAGTASTLNQLLLLQQIRDY